MDVLKAVLLTRGLDHSSFLAAPKETQEFLVLNHTLPTLWVSEFLANNPAFLHKHLNHFLTLLPFSAITELLQTPALSLADILEVDTISASDAYSYLQFFSNTTFFSDADVAAGSVVLENKLKACLDAKDSYGSSSTLTDIASNPALWKVLSPNSARLLSLLPDDTFLPSDYQKANPVIFALYLHLARRFDITPTPSLCRMLSAYIPVSSFSAAATLDRCFSLLFNLSYVFQPDLPNGSVSQLSLYTVACATHDKDPAVATALCRLFDIEPAELCSVWVSDLYFNMSSPPPSCSYVQFNHLGSLDRFVLQSSIYPDFGLNGSIYDLTADELRSVLLNIDDVQNWSEVFFQSLIFDFSFVNAPTFYDMLNLLYTSVSDVSTRLLKWLKDPGKSFGSSELVHFFLTESSCRQIPAPVLLAALCASPSVEDAVLQVSLTSLASLFKNPNFPKGTADNRLLVSAANVVLGLLLQLPPSAFRSMESLLTYFSDNPDQTLGQLLTTASVLTGFPPGEPS